MVHHQCHTLQSHPPITNVDTIQREVSYLALGVSVTPTWSPRYSIHMGPSHLLLVCLLCKSSQPCVLVHFPSIAITPFYPCHPTIPLFSFLPSFRLPRRQGLSPPSTPAYRLPSCLKATRSHLRRNFLSNIFNSLFQEIILY